MVNQSFSVTPHFSFAQKLFYNFLHLERWIRKLKLKEQQRIQAAESY